MSNEDLDRAITYHGEMHAELLDEDLDDLTHVGDDDLDHNASRQSMGSTSVDVSIIAVVFVHCSFFIGKFSLFCLRRVYLFSESCKLDYFLLFVVQTHLFHYPHTDLPFIAQDEDIDAHVHDFQQHDSGDRPTALNKGGLMGLSTKSDMSMDFNADMVEEFNDAQV